MPSIKEIHWLAGLLEGEGSFFYSTTPIISCAMTDRDVIHRLVNTLGQHAKMRGPYMPKGGKKHIWVANLCASTAIAWMMTLWPLMGERRRAQIEKVIAHWKTVDTRAHKGVSAKCHPGKPNRGRGMCAKCYRDHHRAAHPEWYAAYKIKAAQKKMSGNSLLQIA